MLRVESFSHESERTVALARLLSAVAAAIVLWRHYVQSGVSSALHDSMLQYGTLLYGVGSLALLADVCAFRRAKQSRNVLGIVLDVAGITTGIYLAPGLSDPLVFFYMWSMVGTGILFGTHYLALTSTLCVACFVAIVAASPHWQAQPMFAATILAMLLFLGPYLAVLLSRLHAIRRHVLWQAAHDSLTGLLNRRALLDALSRTLDSHRQASAARRGSSEPFLLYLDLDNFKVVNDTAGHAGGDEVLNGIADVLGRCTPEGSDVARLGGDEFCVVLPSCEREVARRCAERVRNAIASYTVTLRGQEFRVGASVGVAPLSGAADIDGWLRLADAACYAAKSAGRNQVHLVANVEGLSATQMIRTLRPTAGTAMAGPPLVPVTA
ncbi:MAG: GGDEF domain-containing protein [Pseudomonadota bacterium]